MAGVLNTLKLAQVGFIVRDVEAAKKKFAEFLGTPVPPTQGLGDYAITQTRYMGEPAPDANCLMAFFNLDNVQFELIQPNGVKSCWQDFLDEHGEGIHHLAFSIQGTDEKIVMCENFGLKCVQRGVYGGANGEYAYFDAMDDLKCIVETLESYPRKAE